MISFPLAHETMCVVMRCDAMEPLDPFDPTDLFHQIVLVSGRLAPYCTPIMYALSSVMAHFVPCLCSFRVHPRNAWILVSPLNGATRLTSGVTELKISLGGDLLSSRVHRYERPRCHAQTPMILPRPENKLHFILPSLWSTP